ncbi:MAG: KOW domain-containing RNA-binding protein [Acutalibacteraceae bacterium]|nr:KOW domain-containing RNA-binding protein [Acutalibacteraceae bacterium]
MKAGQIVKATAGRDKNSFFVVTQVDGAYAVICDGKHRPVERQKRKKLIHLSKTNHTVDLQAVKTNKEFKRVLHPFNFE